MKKTPIHYKLIKKAFEEVFDTAACIQHWHDTSYNKETGECEGMVVSAEKVRELWEVLSKYRDFREEARKAIDFGGGCPQCGIYRVLNVFVT